MRDPDHLGRLYGRRSLPAGFRAGPGLAIWIVGLLLAAAGSTVVAGLSLVAATTDDATTVALQEWGVLAADERWIAVHADDPGAESGCVLTERELRRWQARTLVARVGLTDEVEVDRVPEGLRVRLGDDAVLCPSDPGSDLRAFEALVASRRRGPRPAWHPGPDPRVAHLIGDAR